MIRGGAGRLAEIALFLDAAALGSFSAAGRKHGLSPAAASAAIARLESALGATLFERTTRQLRLTEEGLHYRHYSEQALDLLAQAEDGLHAGGGAVRGVVRVSAPSDIGRQLLLPMLDRFAALHPQVRHALTLTDATANLVQRGKAVEHGQQQLAADVGRRRDAHHAAHGAAARMQAVFGLRQQVQRLFAVVAVVQPLVRQAQLARGAFEQGDAQRRFQARDGGAGGGRRQAVLAAGRGKAAQRRGVEEQGDFRQASGAAAAHAGCAAAGFCTGAE